MSHSISPDLSRRFSPRAFAEREVATALLTQLFEAARWAPSCYNDQPWSFIVTRRGHGSGYAKLLDCLVESNRMWAVTAPVLVLNVARRCFLHNGQFNRHAWYDLGQAVAGLLVEATRAGLHAHQMAGFDAVRAIQAFALPAGFDAVAIMALGYHGEPSRLPSGVSEKSPAARERRPQTAFVFAEQWQSALDAAGGVT